MSASFMSEDFENGAKLLSSPFRSGDIVGNDYELLKELGRGGMGVVFEARHRFIDQTIALKVLYPHLLTEVNWQRFAREAQALGRLNHPGIVRIYNCGIDAARSVPFYVMEQIKGDSLGDLIAERGALDEELAVRAAIEAARALDFAHGVGVVHRDIKPSNLFLPHSADSSSLKLKVLDFGIAALTNDRLSSQEKQKLTITGQIFGTPYYMSPEIITEQTAGAASDIYSLGCTLFELLAGRVPYKGASTFETLGMHMMEPLPSLSETGGREFSSELELLVGRAMAKNPSERYASMKMFAVDLEQYLDRQPVDVAGIKSTGFAELNQAEYVDQLEEFKKRPEINKMLVLPILLGLIFFGLPADNFFKPPELVPQAGSAFKSSNDKSRVPVANTTPDELENERDSPKQVISAEDRRLIKSGYERGHTRDGISYRFPRYCIGEIKLPGGTLRAKGNQFIPLKKNGKNDFIVFSDVDKDYIAGLKPDSFDLVLRFDKSPDFGPAVASTRGWSSLKQIRLDNLIIDREFKQLDELPLCRELSLKNCHLAYPLRDSAQFQNAKMLFLTTVQGPQFQDALRTLPELQNLRSLELSAVKLSHDDLDCIARTNQLETLILRRSEFSAAQLAKVMQLPHLKFLEVTDCPYRPDEILAGLKNCPNRRYLELRLTHPSLPPATRAKVLELKLPDKDRLVPWTADDIAAIKNKVQKFEGLELVTVNAGGKNGFVPLSDL
jgi:serine/threonine protein kinase